MSLPSLNDLSPYYKRVELIQQTADQIIKDFGMYGYSITFTGNAYTAYNELSSQLISWLTHIYEKEPLKVAELLYRIDLPEQKTDRLQVESKADFYTELADRIIKRELQKVVVRNYFKGNL